MHAKTDSEVTSVAASSPPRSPRRPMYYVQSPSRDSHDGEKTAASFRSTPVISPSGSPPHSQSSVGRHSRDSSSTRFSASLKPGSRKKPPPHNHHCAVVEEQGLLDAGDPRRGLPRRCYFLVFVGGFFLLFSLFSFILWAASKPMKPKITIKSITFERFVIQAGSDSTGVATDMISTNSSVRLVYRNTGTFFGVHVTSTPVDLSYSQITVGSGTIKKFYQSRKGHRSLAVSVMGYKIPLYGSGASLSSSTGIPTLPVPMRLSFTVRSRAYVLGRLVRPKYYKRIDCAVTFDAKKLNVPINLKNCTYN